MAPETFQISDGTFFYNVIFYFHEPLRLNETKSKYSALIYNKQDADTVHEYLTKSGVTANIIIADKANRRQSYKKQPIED